MTDLKGSPSASVRAVLERVVEKALSRGATPPPWVAVDDGNGAWVEEVASAPVEERARAVVAARSEGSLLRAIRLGLGGAVWMPPSTLGMADACGAAARAPRPAAVDLAAVDLILDRGGPLVLVTVADLDRWHPDLGEAELVRLLASLARTLGVPSAVVGSAALLTSEPPAGAVRSAWEGVAAQAEWATGLDPVVIPLPQPATGRVPLPVLAHALARCASPAPHRSPATTRLVRVEHGIMTPLGEPPEGGEGAERVPVWASRRPRTGSPTGLLLEHMAARCELSGVPLWIPLVDRSSLPFVLRLPGRLWLDGPAVIPSR